MSHPVLSTERDCRVCGKRLEDSEMALAYQEFDAPLCYRHQVYERCRIEPRATHEQYLQRSGQAVPPEKPLLEADVTLLTRCECGEPARWVLKREGDGHWKTPALALYCWRGCNVRLERTEARLIRALAMDLMAIADHVDRPEVATGVWEREPATV